MNRISPELREGFETIVTGARGLKIKTRLGLLVTLMGGGIAVFIWLYFPARQEWQGREAIAGKAQSIAEMTAFTVGPSVVFDDPSAVTEAFEAARQNADLSFVSLMDDSGRVISAFGLTAQTRGVLEHLDDGEYLSSDGSIVAVTTPVVFDGKKVGKVCVGLSLDHLREETGRSRTAITIVSLAIFLVGMLFAFAVSAVITTPIERMVQAAQHITQGDLTLRVQDASQDEVGLLARAFNEMVDHLEEARRELAAANRSLEERVDQRTRELKKEITHRTKIEGVLRQQIAAIETSVDGMAILDGDGSYVFLNLALARLYGFTSPEELVGHQWQEQYDDAEVAMFRREVMPAVAREGQWKGEARGTRHDGSRFPQELSVSPVPGGGLVFVVHDVTLRKRTEEAQKQLLRAVEQTDDVVFITAVDGTITYVNPAFERLYGYTRADAVGKTPRILRSGLYSKDYYASFWKQLLDGKSVRGEYFNKTRTGETVTIEGTVSPIINADGVLSGFVGVQKNVTERKAEEESRKALELQLAQAQKIESIGTLAGGVAHDFNNILAIILGHAGILELSGKQSPAVTRSVQAITTAVQRGAGIVRQILTFARKTESTVEVIKVNDIVRELVKMVQETFPKNVSFVQCLAHGDPVIRADRTQLHQTLLNLCVNARDAMPGGGTITVRTEQVTDDLLRKKHREAPRGAYVRLSVVDTGSGMDEQTAQRVFEPFFTTKEKGKGTGLGLAVVYGIVKSHNGYIDVTSAPGEGTTFDIHLPQERAGQQDAAAPGGNGTVAGGSETLLIAEDEEMLLAYLESVLQSAGYTVLGARDGKSALDLFTAHQQQIALVMTDLDMPGLNGRQLIDRVRAAKPGCPTILASGFIDPQVREELGKAGINHLLGKPYVADDLMKKIREVLA
jgi:PAS domain S-box-containing protein